MLRCEGVGANPFDAGLRRTLTSAHCLVKISCAAPQIRRRLRDSQLPDWPTVRVEQVFR